METKRFHGKHTCEQPFLIYRVDSEPWDYICPLCRYPIDMRQAEEKKDHNIEQKFPGRLT